MLIAGSVIGNTLGSDPRDSTFEPWLASVENQSGVAQLAAQETLNLKAEGSIPSSRAHASIAQWTEHKATNLGSREFESL